MLAQVITAAKERGLELHPDKTKIMSKATERTGRGKDKHVKVDNLQQAARGGNRKQDKNSLEKVLHTHRRAHEQKAFLVDPTEAFQRNSNTYNPLVAWTLTKNLEG